MKPLSSELKRHHLIQNRRLEIGIGILFFLIGAILVYDAYDARGKKVPWPASMLAPW